MKRGKSLDYVFASMAMRLWMILLIGSLLRPMKAEGAPAAEAPKAEAPSAAPAAPAARSAGAEITAVFHSDESGSENARTLARSDRRCLRCVGNASR